MLQSRPQHNNGCSTITGGFIMSVHFTHVVKTHPVFPEIPGVLAAIFQSFQ